MSSLLDCYNENFSVIDHTSKHHSAIVVAMLATSLKRFILLVQFSKKTHGFQGDSNVHNATVLLHSIIHLLPSCKLYNVKTL